jgi:hypothetical protein
MFKYFRLKEALEEVKLDLQIGDFSDKAASISKLAGKAAANLGLLTAEAAIGLGTHIIKNREEYLVKVADKVLDKRQDNISGDDREKLEEFSKRGEESRERRWREESHDSSDGLSEKISEFVNGTHRTLSESVNDESLVEICTRFSEPRWARLEQAQDSGFTEREFEAALRKPHSYYFASSIPEELELGFRAKVELSPNDFIYFLSNLNRDGSFGEAFSIVGRGIYTLSTYSDDESSFVSRFISWKELASLKVTRGYSNGEYEGVCMSDKTTWLCSQRHARLLSFCVPLVTELAKKSGSFK